METTLVRTDIAFDDEGELRRDLTGTAERDLSAAAMRGFTRIVELWGLDFDQQITLLGIPKSTFYKYRKTPATSRFSKDTLERVSYVLGIYKALAILLPRTEAADAWVKRPNDIFNGQSALDRMLRGNVADLYYVRHYLDAERGA